MTEWQDESQLTIASVLEESAASWNRFLELVDSFPGERVEEPGVCGVWSLKILIGHVSFWDGYEVGRIARGGEPADVDWQALNDQNAIHNADRPFAEVRAELNVNHARVLASVESTPGASPAFVRSMLHDHYLEHGLEIETWMKTQHG